MYLMTTLMSVLSLTRPWLYVLDQEGVSNETFAKEFTRFISPAVSSGVKPDGERMGGNGSINL